MSDERSLKVYQYLFGAIALFIVCIGLIAVGLYWTANDLYRRQEAENERRTARVIDLQTQIARNGSQDFLMQREALAMLQAIAHRLDVSDQDIRERRQEIEAAIMPGKADP